MPYQYMDDSVVFAVDAAIKSSHIRKLDQNSDYVIGKFDSTTGHTHSGDPEDGPPVVIPENSIGGDNYKLIEGDGATTYHTNATERTSYSLILEKKKESTVTRAMAGSRIKFTLRSSFSNQSTWGQVKINGVAVGPEHQNYGDLQPNQYVTSGAGALAAGDTVEVWIRTDDTNRASFVKDLLICGQVDPVGDVGSATGGY